MSREEKKENEIINRHLLAMLGELRGAGHHAEAAVAFIAFRGAENFNIATIFDLEASEKAGSPGKARLALLGYAHDEICELIGKLEEEEEAPPPGERH